MRTITINVYNIDEHPNKEACYSWMRENWYDLNQHGVNELIQSIKALSNKIGGTVNYAVSAEPDRGEHITFKDYSHEDLCRLSTDDCPLTGTFWDIDLIKSLRRGNASEALTTLHNETEYIYSDEGLLEMCRANEYEFEEDGTFIS